MHVHVRRLLAAGAAPEPHFPALKQQSFFPHPGPDLPVLGCPGFSVPLSSLFIIQGMCLALSQAHRTPWLLGGCCLPTDT